jgi:hypothetical protein
MLCVPRLGQVHDRIVRARRRRPVPVRDGDRAQARIERQHGPVGQDHGPLEDVTELANIARPRIAHQAVHRGR